MTSFKNKRQECKYYILELLESDSSYSWSKMKRYIDEKSESEINDSTFTESLKQLVDYQILETEKQGNYRLVKQTVAQKEDFVEEENLNSILEETINRFMINVNQLTIDTLEQFIADLNEYQIATFSDKHQKLSKNILPLRITDYEKKIAESKKQLRKMADDL